MLVDLRPKKVTGKAAEAAMGRAHITCNKNGIPYDPEKPMVTSGVRLGTPAATSRGFGIAEFETVGDLIAEVIDGLSKNGADGNGAVEEAVKAKAHALTGALPDLLVCKRSCQLWLCREGLRRARFPRRLPEMAAWPEAAGEPLCAAPIAVRLIRR
jgi:hypothetical protein